MDGEKNGMIASLGTAFVLVTGTSMALILTALLLTRAGMPFAAAYTVTVLACICGTLAVSRAGRTRIAFPSPAIVSWLVCEEIIAHGFSWQEILGIAAAVSCAGALLARTRYLHGLTSALPPILRTGLVLGLGLTMLQTAALYARVLLPSPWALTMSGTLSDPLTYFTLMGILLVLLLHERMPRAALPLGIILIGVLTWVEGFWEIPSAPFLIPDLEGTAFAFMVVPSDLCAAVTLGGTLLIALSAESMAVLMVKNDDAAHLSLARLFTVSGCMSLLGAFPLTIAPISASIETEYETHRKEGIPLTAVLFALLLAFLLPCAILMQALADFPAMSAVALAVMGLLLLMRGMEMLKCTTNFTLREGAVVAAFVLTAYDMKTGLALALFLWTLLTVVRGEKVPRMTGALTAFFSLFFLLKWIL